MLDIEAAVGIEQLKKYPKIVARRRAVAEFYQTNLEGRLGWKLPPIVPGATYSHYVIRVSNRSEWVGILAARGVQLGELIQYSVPHLETYNEEGNNCENSLIASQTIINLPNYATLDESKVLEIVECCFD